MTKVSIITVCFNAVATIEGTIKSVISQSYSNIEYIIIDGGSSDGTQAVIDRYKDQIDTIVSEPDQGIYDAMNKGIALAKNEVIAILNSDDFYPNECMLADVVKIFEQNPHVDMVLGNVDFVSPNNLVNSVRYYSSYNFAPWKMRFGFMPAHPASFIRRSAYTKIGQYRLTYKIAADFEFFVRAILVNKCRYTKLNKTLVCMREGGVSTTGLKSNWIITKEELRALRENGIYSNLFFVLLRLPIKFFQKVFHKW